MGEELTEKLYRFLRKYFEKPYVAHRKRIFLPSWEEALKIATRRGQVNMFLKRR